MLFYEITRPLYQAALLAALAGLWLMAQVATAEAQTPQDITQGLASAASPANGAAVRPPEPLPMVVLDWPNTLADESQGFLTEGRFSFIEKPGQGVGPLTAEAKIRNMTDPQNFTPLKHDYFLRFDRPVKLPGFEAGTDFLLLGGMGDKSLIRNYVGYRLAAGIMEAPKVELCELFFRGGAVDVYMGVYSLIEKPAAPGKVLFHRAPFESGINIETFGTRNEPVDGKLSIPFMEAVKWDDRFNEAIGQISRTEEMLASTISRTFYSSLKMIDLDSFGSNFILGELTMNYAGLNTAWYYLDTEARLLSAAPLWNFEKAFDNQPLKGAAVDGMLYDQAPYIRQLFKSPQFAGQIQERYLSLRRAALDEMNMTRLIDESAARVGPAALRDWRRWNSYEDFALRPVIDEAEEDEGGAIPFSRQTQTYEEEIIRLKYILREHSLHLAEGITSFNFSEQEVSKEIVLNSNPIWPILFLAGFFWLVRFARRYGV